jgi:hypothetical protein
MADVNFFTTGDRAVINAINAEKTALTAQNTVIIQNQNILITQNEKIIFFNHTIAFSLAFIIGLFLWKNAVYAKNHKRIW